MARYRFHCTNGRTCVFDARGAVVRSPRQLFGRARSVATAVMRTVAEPDWSDWRVTVHDLNGRQVLQEPFAKVLT